MASFTKIRTRETYHSGEENLTGPSEKKAAASPELVVEGASPLQQASLSCPRHSDPWGVWIDGRDAHHGVNSYGRQYSDDMRSALLAVYDKAATKAGEFQRNLTMEDIQQFEALLCGKRNHAWVPVGWPFFCMPFLPSSAREDIEKHAPWVIHPLYIPIKPHDESLAGLVSEYNAMMAKAGQNLTRQLLSLAYLYQSLAFIHPLLNGNSRLRLLVLQFELRQRGIACGTMMYDNGHEVYFVQVDELSHRILEGIDAYKTAQSRNISTPWVGESSSYEVPSFIGRCIKFTATLETLPIVAPSPHCASVGQHNVTTRAQL